MTKRKSKAERDEAEYKRSTDFINSIAELVDNIKNNQATPSVDQMLDEICDPEPISGYTLLDEIEFTLYAAQAELSRLQKLIFLYKDRQDK